MGDLQVAPSPTHPTRKVAKFMRRGRLGPSHTSSYPASFCRLPPSSLCLRTPPSLLLTSTPILPLSFILILLHFTLGWACFLQCTPVFLQMVSLCISLCLHVFLHLLSYLGSLIFPPSFLYLLSPHFPLTLETMSWTSVLTYTCHFCFWSFSNSREP